MAEALRMINIRTNPTLLQDFQHQSVVIADLFAVPRGERHKWRTELARSHPKLHINIALQQILRGKLPRLWPSLGWLRPLPSFLLCRTFARTARIAGSVVGWREFFFIEAAQPRPLQDGQAEKGQEPKPSCISCASFSTACVSAYFQEEARHRWNFEQIGLGPVWGTQKELWLDGWLDTVVFGHSIVFQSSLGAYSCMANAKNAIKRLSELFLDRVLYSCSNWRRIDALRRAWCNKSKRPQCGRSSPWSDQSPQLLPSCFLLIGGTSAQVKAYSAALHSGTMAQMPDVPAVLLDSDTQGLRTAQSSASPLPKASCNREDGLRLQAEIYWSMLTCMEERRGVEAGEWNQKGPGCSFKKIKKRLQEKLSEEFRTRTGSKHQK